PDNFNSRKLADLERDISYETIAEPTASTHDSPDPDPGSEPDADGKQRLDRKRMTSGGQVKGRARILKTCSTLQLQRRRTTRSTRTYATNSSFELHATVDTLRTIKTLLN